MIGSARTGVEGLLADLGAWQQAAKGRSPASRRVLEQVAALLEAEDVAGKAVRDRLSEAWADRRFTWAYDRPLLLLAALRAEALAAGPAHPLWAALGAEPAQPAAATAEAVAAALSPRHAGTFAALRTRVVQTNETSRAVAWLWPAQLAGADAGGRPLALVDLGASAGLNLTADALPAPWKTAAGDPLPVVHRPDVLLRVGLDAHPLDVRRDEDAAWLRACVWAGETARLARFEASVRAFRAAPAGPAAPRLETVAAEAMPDRLAALAATLPPEVLLIAYQTVFLEYVEEPARGQYRVGLDRFLRDARPGRAVWVTLEVEAQADAPRADTRPGAGAKGPPPQAAPALPAAIRARVAGDTAELLLARCGYHPAELQVDAEAVARFRAAVTA